MFISAMIKVNLNLRCIERGGRGEKKNNVAPEDFKAEQALVVGDFDGSFNTITCTLKWVFTLRTKCVRALNSFYHYNELSLNSASSFTFDSQLSPSDMLNVKYRWTHCFEWNFNYDFLFFVKENFYFVINGIVVYGQTFFNSFSPKVAITLFILLYLQRFFKFLRCWRYLSTFFNVLGFI